MRSVLVAIFGDRRPLLGGGQELLQFVLHSITFNKGALQGAAIVGLHVITRSARLHPLGRSAEQLPHGVVFRCGDTPRDDQLECIRAAATIEHLLLGLVSFHLAR